MLDAAEEDLKLGPMSVYDAAEEIHAYIKTMVPDFKRSIDDIVLAMS